MFTNYIFTIYSNYSESSIFHIATRIAPVEEMKVVWITEVRCNGSEVNLGDCDYQGWNFSRIDCPRNRDLALSCLPGMCTLVWILFVNNQCLDLASLTDIVQGNIITSASGVSNKCYFQQLKITSFIFKRWRFMLTLSLEICSQ